MAVPERALQVKSSAAVTPHHGMYACASGSVTARIAPVEPQKSQQIPVEEQTCPGAPAL